MGERCLASLTNGLVTSASRERPRFHYRTEPKIFEYILFSSYMYRVSYAPIKSMIPSKSQEYDKRNGNNKERRKRKGKRRKGERKRKATMYNTIHIPATQTNSFSKGS